MRHVRPLDWPRDRAALQRLELGFATDRIYDVEAGPLRFALVERRVSPPLGKRYEVDWDALAAAPHVVVAEEEGVPTGVAAVAWHPWNRRAELAHLYVDAQARGRGVGADLLREACRIAATLGARCLWVETQQVNAPAIRFYLRHGFICCGLDASLYDPREAPGEVAVFLVAAVGAAGTADGGSSPPDSCALAPDPNCREQQG
jgi:ribosomal protein S18 acetylase RimI-like enzyme